MTTDSAIWQSTSPEPEPAGATALSPRADLVVIGGGYTGLSAALGAAEAGLRVVLIEARQLGHGGSGRNVGLVNAGVWLRPSLVRRKLGETAGQRFLAEFGRGPDRVFELIARHQIRCEARREGTIHAAHAPAGMAELRARWQDWQALGAPVDLMDGAATAAMTGTRAFAGGLLDRRAGTINPMGYCRGLGRAARAAGAEIHTGLRAETLRRGSAGWQVATQRGQVDAPHVLLATNAYTDGLWPGLAASFTPIDFFQMATEPLGAAAAAILPGGQGLWDTGRVMFSLRRDGQGRLILGSMGRHWGGPDGGLSRRWAVRQLARLFPDLGPVRFEAAWDGRIAMTRDSLPHLHRLDEGLYTPIGYNGRGIITGTILGAALAAHLTGGGEAALPLGFSTPRRLRAAPLMARLYRLAFAGNQIMRGF